MQGFLLAKAELILTNLCDSLSDAPDQGSLDDERKNLIVFKTSYPIGLLFLFLIQ